MKRNHAIIKGKVQGVFFRASMQRAAKSLGLSGWVRNLPDGSVEAIWEGAESNSLLMLDWCHQGPPGAVVREVAATEEPYSGDYTDFSIRY